VITTINDLRAYLIKGQLQFNDILSIMTVLRIQIENDNQKSTYQWINLFANWCVHSKISKSNLAIDIFRTFYGALGNYDFTKGQSMKGFYDYIFNKLRNELRGLLHQHNIPTGLMDNEQAFCAFLIGLLLIVKDRPVETPDKLGESQKNELAQMPKLLKSANTHPELDLTPVSLSIKHADNGTFDCSLTTQGMKNGRLIFNLSTIGYKDKALAFTIES
jgi:hypothetical protein